MSHFNQPQPSAPDAEFPILSESAAALLSTPAYNVPSSAFAASPFGQSMPMFAPSSPIAPLTSTNAGGPFVFGGALPISSSSGIAAAAASPFGQVDSFVFPSSCSLPSLRLDFSSFCVASSDSSSDFSVESVRLRLASVDVCNLECCTCQIPT
jgi:hypothetical protein